MLVEDLDLANLPRKVVPVTFPPGRARLATRPSATGSAIPIPTIGIALVACLAARTPGLVNGHPAFFFKQLVGDHPLIAVGVRLHLRHAVADRSGDPREGRADR
jgi:hypothetical protein